MLPATVYQGTYLGLETTDTNGFPVRADVIVKLAAWDIAFSPRPKFKEHRTPGHKFATGFTQGKETSEGRSTGEATVYDLLYYFTGLLGTAVVTPVTPAKTWDWIWTPDPGCSDLFQYFTLDKGCGDTASELVHAVLTSGGLHVTETDVTITGDVQGGLIDDTATIPDTPVPVDLPDVSLDPECVDIFVGDDGTVWNQLLACMDYTWTLGARRRVATFLNCEVPSANQSVELAFPSTFALVVAQDSQASDLLTRMRTAKRTWLRALFKAVPIPDDLTNFHECEIWGPTRITASDRADQNGIWGDTYTFNSVLNQTFGSGIKVRIRCGVDTLANVVRLKAIADLLDG